MLRRAARQTGRQMDGWEREMAEEEEEEEERV